MFPYIFLLIIGFCFVLLPAKNDKFSFLILSTLLIILAVFRSPSVGTDNIGYLDTFYRIGYSHEYDIKYYLKNGLNYEPGLIYIYVFLHKINAPIITGAAILFIIQFLGIYKISTKYSVRPILSLLLYIAFGYYFISLNIMRQFASIGLVFYFIDYLFKNKIYKFVGIILISSFLLHKSSLLLLSMPIIYILRNKFPCQKKKYILIIILSWLSYYFIEFILPILSKLTFVGEVYILYLTNKEFLATNQGNNIMTLNTLFMMLIVWYSRNFKNIFLLCSLTGLVVCNVLFSFSNVAGRISFGLSILVIIYFPYLFYSIKSKKERYILAIATIIYSSIYCYIMFFAGNAGNIIPYTFYQL